jgi:hypothetical protein
MNAKQRRYPRLPKSMVVAGIALIAWERRELRVESVGDYTDIILRIPVPREFGSFSGLWSVLSPSEQWSRHMTDAVSSSRYAGKPLERQVGNALYPVYATAIKSLLTDVKDAVGEEYVRHFEEEFKNYDNYTHRAKGQQRSLSKAVRMAQVYEKYHSLVQKALTVIKKWPKSSDENLLDKEISELVPMALFRRALAEVSKKVTGEPAAPSRLTRAILGTTAREITHHMIQLELPPSEPGRNKLSTKTIAAHIRWANRFLKEEPDFPGL